MKTPRTFALTALLLSTLLGAGCLQEVNAPERLSRVCAPSILDFGNVSIGLPLVDSFLVKNCGEDSVTVRLSISSERFIHLRPGDSLLQLAPTDSQYVLIEFKPIDKGRVAANDTLRMPWGSMIVRLQANATDSLRPLCLLHPDSIDFGFVDLGKPKIIRFSLFNCGRDTLTLTRESLPSEFFLREAPLKLPLKIAPRQEEEIGVTFRGFEPGRYTATYSVIWDSNASSVQLSAKIAGARLCVSVDTLNFGSAKVGTSVERTVTIGNCGTTTLEFTSLLLEGSAAFQSTDQSPPAAIPGESSTTRTLLFKPTSRGSAVARFIIETSGGTHEVILRGTGL